MFRIGDLSVTMAILLTLASVGLCIWYGIKNWNEGGEVSEEEAMEEKHWDEEEEFNKLDASKLCQ